jgi:glutamate-1-semialdehyde 2,1-aminomutase
MVSQLRAEIEAERVAPATAPVDVLVGGTNSAFPLPFTGCIDRALGTRVWDESGREYVDFLLASGPLILGHSHPDVMEAVSAQLRRGTAYYAVNRPAVELAERLVEIPGCVELVRFASTGTEATLHAVRLARACTGRDKVLVFSRGYHGSHDVSIVAHQGAVKAQSGGVPARVVEDVLVAGFNDIHSVERAFAEHSNTIAAVLLEPQQRSAEPAAGFLEQVRDICHRNGALFIFDEVLTGFRLAYGGAQERYGVEPDLVCYGKIVGGGFPLSAVGGRREIMSLADPARASAPGFVHFSGTLSGNPVSASAGLATLAQLRQPGVYDRLYSLGERLRRGLNQALADCGLRGSAIGSGPIAAVVFDESGPGDARLLKQEINRQMIRRGILVQLQTRFYLSLLHTESEIDHAVEIFADSLRVASISAGVTP